MYKVNIVCVGSLKEKFFYQAQEEYLKRLKKYCEVCVFELEEEKLNQNPTEKEIEKALDREYQKIIPYLKGKIIVCAVEGKQYSSIDFSDYLIKSFNDYNCITFIIGSSYGLSQKLKTDNFLLSLSKMTFPHHLMRIFLQEQIYRAFTIKNNNTYHK